MIRWKKKGSLGVERNMVERQDPCIWDLDVVAMKGQLSKTRNCRPVHPSWTKERKTLEQVKNKSNIFIIQRRVTKNFAAIGPQS